MAMSSANCALWTWHLDSAGAINMLNSSGLRGEPCGTPDVYVCLSDSVPLYTTVADLLLRNALIHVYMRCSTPIGLSLYYRYTLERRSAPGQIRGCSAPVKLFFAPLRLNLAPLWVNF